VRSSWGLVALVACGHQSPPSALDAAPTPSDTSLDGGGDAVVVTVLTLDRTGDIDPTARVLFVDPDDTLVVDQAVDADGHAAASLPLGGSIHVIRSADAGTTHTAHIETIRGVKPGDHLTAGKLRAPNLHEGSPTTMTATWTPVGVIPNNQTQFFTACATTPGVNNSTSVSLPLSDGCHDSNVDVLAIAPEPGGPSVTYGFVWLSVPYVAGGPFVIPNTWTVMQLSSGTLIDEPSTVFGIMLRSTLFHGVPVAVQIVNSALDVSHPSPGVEVYSKIAYPQGVGDGTFVQVQLHDFTNSEGRQYCDYVTPNVPDTVMFDYTPLALPWVTTAPVGSASGATWSEVGTQTIDARIVYWQGSWQANGETSEVFWTLVDDGRTPGEVLLPRLPASYASFDPGLAVGAISLPEPSVYYVNYDVLDGYDASRPYGDMLADPIGSLGAFAGVELQRRLSTSFLAKQPE
jgi:hypothetical protein